MAMIDSKWGLLEQLVKAGVTPVTLPANLESVIAERLEEALAAPGRGDLDDIKIALADFFHALLARASDETTASVRGGSAASEDGVAAFWLGQIAFAQHLAAQAAERRADDRFMQVFTNPTLAAYVRALAAADHTGKELAAALQQREETVSRKLGELRELGVVDYRRDGTRFYNFLTPQARSAMVDQGDAESLAHRDPVKVRMMKKRQQGTSEPFRIRQTLSVNPLLLGH